MLIMIYFGNANTKEYNTKEYSTKQNNRIQSNAVPYGKQKKRIISPTHATIMNGPSFKLPPDVPQDTRCPPSKSGQPFLVSRGSPGMDMHLPRPGQVIYGTMKYHVMNFPTINLRDTKGEYPPPQVFLMPPFLHLE